ncbi:MAG: hypothetical protein ABH919_02145 [bacterium]
MRLKEFLKPTKEKDVIFFVIFFFTIFLRGIVNETGLKFLQTIEAVFSPHYFLYESGGNFIILILRDFLPSAGPLSIILSYAFLIMPFIIGLIYWYILACLIVFLYDKLKNKGRREP